jgi:predicted SAM-dependent methyltransferase
MNNPKTVTSPTERLSEAVEILLEDSTTTHGLARSLRTVAKELKIHRHHRASLSDRPDRRVAERPENVQIGGGTRRIPGFYNIDAVPPAELVWDVREGIPLHDATVELLFSEHFLEHIDYPRSAKYYAREAYRVLSPGGKVITGVPDAAYVLSRYPAPPEQANLMISRWYANRNCLGDFNTFLDLINYVFRDQDDDPKYTPHLWAYDAEKLTELFSAAGFATVEPWPFDPRLAAPERRWASVYVVATK